MIEGNHFQAPESEGPVFSTFYVVAESIFACYGAGERGWFYSHSFQDHETRWIDFEPEIAAINSLQKDQNKWILYSAENVLSSDGSRFVSALKIAKRIDIFNNQIEHQISISYDDSPRHLNFNSKKDADWHNTFAHFDGLYAGEDLIYVLNNKMSLSGQLADDHSEVNVFTMEGEPMTRYQLDANNKCPETIFGDFCVHSTISSSPFKVIQLISKSR